jgi:hypothetical protein
MLFAPPRGPPWLAIDVRVADEEEESSDEEDDE